MSRGCGFYPGVNSSTFVMAWPKLSPISHTEICCLCILKLITTHLSVQVWFYLSYPFLYLQYSIIIAHLPSMTCKEEWYPTPPQRWDVYKKLENSYTLAPSEIPRYILSWKSSFALVFPRATSVSTQANELQSDWVSLLSCIFFFFCVPYLVNWIQLYSAS